jgi:hypothetical protein
VGLEEAALTAGGLRVLEPCNSGVGAVLVAVVEEMAALTSCEEIRLFDVLRDVIAVGDRDHDADRLALRVTTEAERTGRVRRPASRMLGVANDGRAVGRTASTRNAVVATALPDALTGIARASTYAGRDLFPVGRVAIDHLGTDGRAHGETSPSASDRLASSSTRRATATSARRTFAATSPVGRLPCETRLTLPSGTRRRPSARSRDGGGERSRYLLGGRPRMEAPR